jgi:hypothetical protein
MNRLSSSCRILAGLVVLSATLAGVPPASAQKSNFTIGTATGTPLSTCPSDPGGVSGNCWGLNVTCPEVTQIYPYDATVKVTSPSGRSIGTVIFIVGGGGIGFYDTQYTYGDEIIDTLVNAGYTTAQIEFNNTVAGWMTGPAGDGNGPIALACLPATAMQWVHANVLTAGTPLCATANSGGSAAIAFALAQYGLGSMLSMAEPTSGPPLARIDHGCAPSEKYVACATCGAGKPGTGEQGEGYGLSNAEHIDPAYDGIYNGQPTGICSQGVLGSTTNAKLFHIDSILSNTYQPTLSYPTTDIHFAFGGMDKSGGAVPEGIEWAAHITSKTTIVCVPFAGHDLASYPDGATQIENDLIGYCKLQP